MIAPDSNRSRSSIGAAAIGPRGREALELAQRHVSRDVPIGQVEDHRRGIDSLRETAADHVHVRLPDGPSAETRRIEGIPGADRQRSRRAAVIDIELAVERRLTERDDPSSRAPPGPTRTAPRPRPPCRRNAECRRGGHRW